MGYCMYLYTAPGGNDCHLGLLSIYIDYLLVVPNFTDYTYLTIIDMYQCWMDYVLWCIISLVLNTH